MPWPPYTVHRAARRHANDRRMGAYRVDETMVGSGANSQMRPVARASSDFFTMLGVRPMRGRFFGAGEDEAMTVIGGSILEDIVRERSGQPGKSIRSTTTHTRSIGIAPAGFTGVGLVASMRGPRSVPPCATRRTCTSSPGWARRQRRRCRRRRYASRSGRRNIAKLGALAARASYWRRRFATTTPLLVSRSRRRWRWLAAISAIILFVSCANVANLLLARLARRRRELAVRMALGSGRGRVIRLLAIEGLLLALGAAITGLLVMIMVEPIVKGSSSFRRRLDFLARRLAHSGRGAGLHDPHGAARFTGSGDPGWTRRSERCAPGGSRGGETRQAALNLTVVQATLSVVLLVMPAFFCAACSA